MKFDATLARHRYKSIVLKITAENRFRQVMYSITTWWNPEPCSVTARRKANHRQRGGLSEAASALTTKFGAFCRLQLCAARFWDRREREQWQWRTPKCWYSAFHNCLSLSILNVIYGAVCRQPRWPPMTGWWRRKAMTASCRRSRCLLSSTDSVRKCVPAPRTITSPVFTSCHFNCWMGHRRNWGSVKSFISWVK